MHAAESGAGSIREAATYESGTVERALVAICGALELDAACVSGAGDDGERILLAHGDVELLSPACGAVSEVPLGEGRRSGKLRFLSRPGARDLSGRELATLEAVASTVAEAAERRRQARQRLSVLEQAIVERTAAQRLSEATLASYEAELVKRLGMAVEYRDDDTGAHVERVSHNAGQLACVAGLPSERCELVRHAAPLHDVGKVAVPDSVLLKPGPLDPSERATVETHAAAGWELLRGSAAPVLRVAAEIALTHHERYDGRGYPRALPGDEIDVEGRIVAIADVFDALSSDRVYRRALPPDRVREVMLAERGSHFDPDLLDLFLTEVAPS